jgi:hypothetical protein
MIKRIVAAALALLLTSPLQAASEDRPSDYAVRIALTPAPGAALQQVSLPARVLVASRDAGLADVRIFDANGQPVPIALAPVAIRQERRKVSVPVLPILGAADALAVTGVSLKIDGQNRASVVQVDGKPRSSNDSQLLGILLDTRQVADPISALVLDVATPAGQPVTLQVESSADLKDWQPLADKVVYRTSADTTTETIDVPAQDPQGRYLRVTWQATSRLLSPVIVRAATAFTARDSAGTMPRAVLTVPAMTDAHAIEFTLPFAAAVAALEITLAGKDTLVPVRILGRNQDEEPWTPVASGSLFRVSDRGKPSANPAIALARTRFGSLRIEADARSRGFAVAPRIAVRLQPVQIAFLATGPAPFTLAAGKAEAAPAFLALDDLLRTGTSGVTNTLPLATTAGEADPVVAVLAPPHGTPWRRVALWGVLLAGTALLAGMVWMLLHRRDVTT